MKNTLRSRKGMTLVELMVGLVILSVITLAVSSTFAPMLRTYFSANELAEVNNLLDTLSAEMLSDLSGATRMLTLTDADELQIVTATGTITYSVTAEGYLQRNGNLVLGALFYHGKTLAVTYYDPANMTAALAADDTVPSELLVRLTLMRDSTPIAGRDYVAAPIGL